MSILDVLDQFDERTGEGRGVHEGDAMATTTDARLLVDEPRPLIGEVLERLLDVGHGKRHVVHPLSPLLEEPANRRVVAEGLEELNEGAPDGKHRLVDSLRLDGLSVQRLDAILPAELVERGIEIAHGDAHVIEVVGEHRRNATRLPSDGSPPTTLSRMRNPVITSIARTPIGRFSGVFTPMTAMDLGGVAIAAALDRAGLVPESIDEVLFGHVLQAGQGQITARQAARKADVPMTVPATTINKVCLSGMTAIAEASRRVRLGEANFLVAGGMESMTNAPYVLPKVRQGLRMGDATLIDSMQHDGLWCAFDHCIMGDTSDRKNAQLGIGREEQDEWAVASHERAAAARDSGVAAREIATVTVAQRRDDPLVVEHDEGIRDGVTLEGLGALRPAFVSDGTITAGNASQISDGAAAVVVADRDAAEANGLPVVAEILAYGQTAGPDATLHERPAEALRRALKRIDMEAAALDLVEINEAFASVALWSARMLEIDHSRVNVNGGAVAIGHPLGASGARIVVSLINALRERGGGIGGAALCGGGGQGDALIVKVEG